jgi:UDP-glucose 4-epimerase
MAAQHFNKPGAHKNLWAYTLHPAAARACLLSLTAPFTGHEAFFIVAPDTTHPRPSLDLAREFYPDVPVTGDLGGHNAFFSSQKAERLLGWRHEG